MRKLLPILILCAACASGCSNKSDVAAPQPSLFITQTSAPAPDYRAILQAAATSHVSGIIREATSRPPTNAKSVGDLWIKRLEQRAVLLGYGLSSNSKAAPVGTIDVGMTDAAFDAWARENGWKIPDHIRWSFVPELRVATVGNAARAAIRYWPASTARTGMQVQALHGGRIELRDGCFFVGEGGQPGDKLAWFHAEIGFDIDEEGYAILRDRLDGSTRARLGENMNWAGPATATISEDARRALLDACGPAEIRVVGSPESSKRFDYRVNENRTHRGQN